MRQSKNSFYVIAVVQFLGSERGHSFTRMSFSFGDINGKYPPNKICSKSVFRISMAVNKERQRSGLIFRNVHASKNIFSSSSAFLGLSFAVGCVRLCLS